MTNSRSLPTRWQITLLIAVAELAHLAWEHFHGGIQSHHLLHRADLPSISNAWGVVFLPALAWIFSGRFLARAAKGSAKRVAAAFFGALVVGIALSTAFASGHEDVSSYIFLGILLAGLILPVHRGEYVLGFVLGMTFTFGAVLPALAAAFVATVSAIAHCLIRPALGWVVSRARA